jgi:hypothetical protein
MQVSSMVKQNIQSSISLPLIPTIQWGFGVKLGALAAKNLNRLMHRHILNHDIRLIWSYINDEA